MDPRRSSVRLEARSNVGLIVFEGKGVDGRIEAALDGGRLHPEVTPTAILQFPLVALQSGKPLYDRELLRRLRAHQFPDVTLELAEARLAGPAGLYTVAGTMTLHGHRRTLQGAVTVTLTSPIRLLVSGEEQIDVRDYGLEALSTRLLKVEPTVKLRLQIEARV